MPFFILLFTSLFAISLDETLTYNNPIIVLASLNLIVLTILSLIFAKQSQNYDNCESSRYKWAHGFKLSQVSFNIIVWLESFLILNSFVILIIALYAGIPAR